MPADGTFEVVEHAVRIAAGEEDRKPGADHHEDGAHVDEQERDVVGDGQEPLHQGEPAIELPSGVRVAEVQVHGLFLIGGRVAVIHQQKSTRLNSSHMSISYAVFCLKKKKKKH